MIGLYLNHSASIFPQIRYRQLRHLLPGTNGFYDPTVFEDILKDRMGETKLKDSLTHIMIPATDIKEFKPVWIQHFKGHKDKKSWGSMLLRDAVRASSTAPTIFPSRYVYTQPNESTPDVKERHAFIDGTFFGGSMARRAYTAAKKIAPKDAKIVVVHIGTGFMSSSKTPEEFNKLSPLELVTTQEDGPSILNMSLNMFSMDIHKDLHEEMGDDFFEFDAQINNGMDTSPTDSIDDASEDNLQKLDTFAKDNVIKENQQDFDRLCTLLEEIPEINATHEKSQDAFEKLQNYLLEAPNVKQLDKRYKKIIQYSCQIPSDKMIAQLKGEDAVWTLSHRLVEYHLSAIDHIYRMTVADLHYKSHHSPGFFKRMANKLFRRNKPEDEQKPSVANDNTTNIPNKKKPPKGNTP